MEKQAERGMRHENFYKAGGRKGLPPCGRGDKARAFSYPGRIENGKIGCPYEHWMVNELRRRDGILSLSLVAEVEQQVVGHIICSKAVVLKRRNNCCRS